MTAAVEGEAAELPDEWADSLLTLDDLEPGVGSVVVISADGRLEPAMHTQNGWVTPSTWLSEEWWTWFNDDTAIFLVFEGPEGTDHD